MPLLHCCWSAFAAIMVVTSALGGPPPSVPYRWKSVQMVGAGFVDGIVFHPTAKGVCYARTDMGGAYRWDPKANRRQPILDWVSYPDTNLMGVESIALDPHDSKRVYLACGTYTSPQVPNGAILRSSDSGRTFQRTNVPFKFGGNENGRGNGERMSVDPYIPGHLILGTRHNGLWESFDYGATWTKNKSFPNLSGGSTGSEPSVVVTAFPANGVVSSKPRTEMYTAVSQANVANILRSRDSGATWQPIPGQQTKLVPTHMIAAGDGAFYISYGTSGGPSPMSDGAIWRFDSITEKWTDVTPERPDPVNGKRFGYAAVAVQVDKPNVVIASTFGHNGGEQIFRSVDSGKTWKPCIGGKETYDRSKAPYTERVGIHWLLDIEIDPANPDHALFTTGYGGHETFNLSDADRGKPVKWQIMSSGIEESVALELCSPTKGAYLLSAIGDYGGFVHWDLDKPAPEGNFVNPHFGNTDGIAAAENSPNVIVRVGRASGYDVRVNIGYSLDFGRTWKPAKPPVSGASSGHVALSPDGRIWIWSVRGKAYRTTDLGETWTECQGLSPGLRVESDRVNPLRFYALDLFGGRVLSSTDGGLSFTASSLVLRGGLPKRGGERGDSRGGQDHLYATPGTEGDLWIAAWDGLHHSVDGGATFTRIPGVTEIHGFGFGKGKPSPPKLNPTATLTLPSPAWAGEGPEPSPPTPSPVTNHTGEGAPDLYLVGVIDGVRGMFRSDDLGSHWVRINDDAHQWGLVLHITGDPKVYGRVYVGTHGRGTFYGDPR